MKTNNQDIFQITEVDRTVFKRSSTKETLDIQNYHLHSAERVVQLYVVLCIGYELYLRRTNVCCSYLEVVCHCDWSM